MYYTRYFIIEGDDALSHICEWQVYVKADLGAFNRWDENKVCVGAKNRNLSF